MLLYELFNKPIISESIHDKNIFKAIFIAGGPGSGKSHIARSLDLANVGFKIVDIDEVLMRFKNKGRENINHEQAWPIVSSRQSLWIKNYLGLAIIGTGKRVDRLTELNSQLKQTGYDTAMVFVNVDIEVAKERVITRAQNSTHIGDRGRTVPEDYLISAHEAAKENAKIYANLFGQNFIDIENNTNPEQAVNNARRMVNNFLKKPLTQIANQIIYNHKNKLKAA